MASNTTPTGSSGTTAAGGPSGVNPVLFNNQVYLLDYFSSNAGRGPFADRKQGSSGVEQLSIDNANALLPDTSMTHLDGFIQGLLPVEYAQLHPVVKLFLVTPEDKQILVPLSAGADINSSGFTSGFYSGRTAGLKSLSMRVDGNTDQVSGKIYNIDMTFVFDSLNTFFNPVSQDTSITWASILRSYDINNAGGTRLKLCIGYETSNGELRSKFALKDNFFVCYLQFISSELNVEDNLKTSIKVKFQSFEEGLLAEREVFDFLKLKQSAGIANVKQQLKDHAKRSEKEYATLKRNKIQEVEKLLATNQAHVEAIKRGEIEPGYMPQGRAAASMTSAARESARMSNFTEAINKAKKKEAELQTKLKDIQKAKPADFAPKKHKENEEKRKELELKMETFRRDHINESLNKMLFSKPVFTTVQLNSNQVASYLDLLKADAPARKDLLNPNTTAKTKGTHSTVGKPATSHKEMSPEALAKKEAAIQAKIKKLKNEIEDARAQFSTGKGAGFATAKRAIKANREKIKALEKEKKIKKENLKTTQALGNLDSIRKSLKEYKHIEFVTLGDLLSCVMNYLGTTNKGVRLELVKRELILLTQMELSDPQSTGKNSILQNMYHIPIATDQLRLFFQNQLFGKFVQVMTVFDLFKGVIRIIKNAQTRRATINKSMSISANNYRITFTPHAVEKSGKGVKISTKVNSSAGVRSGVIFSAINSDSTFPNIQGLSGNRSENVAAKIPHFILGGAPQGAVKSIKISERTVKGLREAAYENNMGSKKGKISSASSFIPAVFKVDVTLCGTPFFCMTGYFYLGAPSLAIDEADGSWFQLPGYYKIIGIEHSYRAKGQYDTTVQGILEVSQHGLNKNKAKAVEIYNGAVPSLFKVKPTAGRSVGGKRK